MTPGCTTQACDFRDAYENFSDLNAVILGVSPDGEDSHQKFIKKHDLPFSLLVDEEHKLADEFGVWKLKKNFGKEYYGIERSTFIIDPEGNLQKEYRKVRVKGHVEEALQDIKDNQYTLYIDLTIIRQFLCEGLSDFFACLGIDS